MQESLQVASVGARPVELPHRGAALALSVCPGHLEKAPGMGPAPSTASISSLWHTWSLVTTLRRGSCVKQASCVNRGSVLELTNTSGIKSISMIKDLGNIKLENIIMITIME